MTTGYTGRAKGKTASARHDVGTLNVTGRVNIQGVYNEMPQFITAAGATQGAAILITKTLAILSVVTASARGARLPATPTTGDQYMIMNDAAQGCKIYPGANGTLGSASTNTAVVLAARKGITYVAVNATHWVAQAGA